MNKDFQYNDDDNYDVKTVGIFNSSARLLLNEIGKKISINTGEITETSFLFQRTCLSVSETFQCYAIA